jgi:hypothetical protein
LDPRSRRKFLVGKFWQIQPRLDDVIVSLQDPRLLDTIDQTMGSAAEDSHRQRDQLVRPGSAAQFIARHDARPPRRRWAGPPKFRIVEIRAGRVIVEANPDDFHPLARLQLRLGLVFECGRRARAARQQWKQFRARRAGVVLQKQNLAGHVRQNSSGNSRPDKKVAWSLMEIRDGCRCALEEVGCAPAFDLELIRCRHQQAKTFHASRGSTKCKQTPARRSPRQSVRGADAFREELTQRREKQPPVSNQKCQVIALPNHVPHNSADHNVASPLLAGRHLVGISPPRGWQRSCSDDSKLRRPQSRQQQGRDSGALDFHSLTGHEIRRCVPDLYRDRGITVLQIQEFGIPQLSRHDALEADRH